MAANETLKSVGAPRAAVVAEITRKSGTPQRSSLSHAKATQRSALRPAGVLFTATGSLVWILGLLGSAACVAPWLSHGWLWLELVGAIVALLAFGDALALWRTRKELVPILLRPERGFRGSEGQTIPVSFALTGTPQWRSVEKVRIALMPSTRESETAIRVNTEPQWLNLERPDAAGDTPSLPLWPWTPEVALLRRGVWTGPRVGIERRSLLGIWCLRQWFDSPEPLRIEADLRAGRREILNSPIYRLSVASRQTPWTGHGRDFERLREYQPGDNFSEIAWKATARRGAPVTRLFQWEQKQEVYFVVDQSRSSAVSIDPSAQPEKGGPQNRATKRLLDVAVETALVGATAALELGDEFGLVTYADEPKSWLRAGSGKTHFHQFRDRLLNLEPLPTGADYEALFGAIRVRLRRRAYLVLLANLAERAVSDSLSRGTAMVRSSHVVLITSLLPAHARPAFSPNDNPHTNEDVYTALAGEKENQRLGALARNLGQWDVQLRFVPPETFLRTAVGGYLENKREQRL
jgi:uncharacterized protein (DUF58 family)